MAGFVEVWPLSNLWLSTMALLRSLWQRMAKVYMGTGDSMKFPWLSFLGSSR